MSITPFHLVVRATTNPAAGDTIAIGLILWDGEKYLYRFSRRKQAIASQLAPGCKRAMQQVIQQLSQSIEADAEARISGVKSYGRSVLLPSDWDYLHKYSNGLLRIGSATPIMIFENENSSSVFENIYHKLIDGYSLIAPEIPLADIQLTSEPVRRLIERVDPHIHTEVQLNPRLLPALFFDLRLTCLGLNGSFTAAHNLPLEQFTMPTLQQHVFEYETVAQTLIREYHKESKDNAFYLLCNEPNKETEPTKHKFWEAISGHPVLKVIPTGEAGIVAERVERTGAKRFLRPRRLSRRARVLSGE